MMATIRMTGIEEYSRALQELERRTRDEVIGRAVYEGTAIVADAVKSELTNLPTDSGRGSQEHPLDGINRAQKTALIAAMGVSRMQEKDGFVHTKIGFDGYNPIKTKRWMQGQPNAMIARSAERGTSFLKANPFMKRAVRQCKKRVIGIMGTIVDAEIKKIMDKK